MPADVPHLTRHAQQKMSFAGKGLTLRSVLLGLLMVAYLSVGGAWGLMLGGLNFTWSFFPIGVGAPYVLLIFANALVHRQTGRWFLNPAELVVILIMGLVVSGMPIFIVGSWVAIISAPYYAATPENNWAGYIHPFLPDWLIPRPEGDAMRWFWEGLPTGYQLPLKVWLGPLCWWLSLFLAIYFVCMCLVVLLRRQWVDHERLIFPLTELPRLLLENGGSGILRSRGFWIGCLLPFSIMCYNVLGYIHPGFPQLAFDQGFTHQFSRDFPAITVQLYLPVIGFMFLASTNITFSIWFFYVLSIIQEGITNRIGLGMPRSDPFMWGLPTVSWQAWGAFVGMVLWGFWIARHHLGTAIRQVLGGHRALDDREELLSYRTALIGTVAGLLYILGWFYQCGMSLHVALLFMFGFFVAYLGITRLVIQAGVYYVSTPVNAQAFTVAITGTDIGTANLLGLGMSYSWFGDVQSIFMPSAAHAAKLNETCANRRSMSWAIGLAVVAGFVITTASTVYICYRHGAGNLSGGAWYFHSGGGLGGLAFNGVIHHLNNPLPADWTKLGYFGFGLLSYSLLALCQQRFFWWPLHPIGLAVGPVWMIHTTGISIFLGWLCKKVVLYYGGVHLYLQMRPFFIGLIVGYFLGYLVLYGIAQQLV